MTERYQAEHNAGDGPIATAFHPWTSLLRGTVPPDDRVERPPPPLLRLFKALAISGALAYLIGITSLTITKIDKGIDHRGTGPSAL